ncbi:hypothetical protein GCM10027269_16890 [Kribbella endophytica]
MEPSAEWASGNTRDACAVCEMRVVVRRACSRRTWCAHTQVLVRCPHARGVGAGSAIGVQVQSPALSTGAAGSGDGYLFDRRLFGRAVGWDVEQRQCGQQGEDCG